MLLALMIPWLAELLCLILIVMRTNWRALHNGSPATVFSCLKKGDWKHPPQFNGFCFFILQKTTMEFYRREVSGPCLTSRCSSCMYCLHQCCTGAQSPLCRGWAVLKKPGFDWQRLCPMELWVNVLLGDCLPLPLPLQAASSSPSDGKAQARTDTRAKI